MTESSNTRKTIDVTLKTDNCDLIFHFHRSPFSNHAYVTITIVSYLTHLPYTIKSTQASTSKRWMLLFGDYLMQHIKNIRNNNFVPSEEFMGEGMLYRTNVTGGKLQGEGVNLNMRFWVDAGVRKRIWVAIETKVNSREIDKFFRQIRR